MIWNHAWRAIAGRPAMTVIAVLSLATGIGASTAMFSVLDTVLLKPLPYTNAERLAVLWGDLRTRHVKDWPFSAPDFDDLRRGTTDTFEAIGGVSTAQMPLTVEGGEPELVIVGAVTSNFFRVMNARIEFGRDFNSADEAPEPGGGLLNLPGAAPRSQTLPTMVILSHDFWKRRYGGDAGVLGRKVDFASNRRGEIVGVLAPGFELMFAPDKQVLNKPEMWVANRVDYKNSSRLLVGIVPIGRLRRGVSFEQAQTQAENVSADLRRRFIIDETAGLHFRVEPMHEDLVRDVRPALAALMGAVIFLFLIACANVVNLVLVRASTRERELAVRAALGATRWHLIRQMLAESVLFSSFGALLGIAVAALGIKLLIWIGPEDLPRLEEIRMNTAVLGYAFASGFVAAVVFGVFPALRASKPDIIDTLRTTGRTGGLAAATLMRKGVVAVEVALSFVLLIGSGLMLRSLSELERVNPGFDARGLLTFVIANLPGTAGERGSIERQVQERLRAIPGVQAVTGSDSLPLDGGTSPVRWGTGEAANDPGKFKAANLHVVLPGYFDTLKTRLIAGRTYTDDDNNEGRSFIIVDDILARKAFPHETAIGKRILTRFRTPEAEWFQIIGVVEHERDLSLAREGREELFIPDGYVGYAAVNRWAVRTSGDPMRLVSAVRSEVKAISPQLIITEVQPMQKFVDKAQAETRFALLLIGIFAIIAALLAAVGLYGVLSAAVQQRTAEIGVRMAVGARPTAIFGLMIGQGLKLSAMGMSAGILAAFALTRIMTSILVGIKPTDPATYASMLGLFFAIAALACWVPAWRAASLDPTLALRTE